MLNTLFALDAKVKETLELAREKFPNSDFPDIPIDMTLTGKVAGQFCYNPKKLRFNFDLMMQNKSDFISQTVPHEVAHYVSQTLSPGDKPHGAVWCAVMHLFGCPARVTHDYETTKDNSRYPYVYNCRCKTWHLSITRHRRSERYQQRYHCPDCKSRLVYSHREKI